MRTTTLSLAYGTRSLPVRLPTDNLLAVLETRPGQETPDEASLLAAALAQPIGAPRLGDLVRPGQKVAIVTSDLTRPCPSGRLLPPVLTELTRAGVPAEDVTIVLALGLHRPMTPQEIAQALSPQVVERYRVSNHDPQDTLRLGVTSCGTPVELFKPLVEADFRICLGNIEFHYYAGFSGGAKAILPGCASRVTVNANHAMLLRQGASAGQIEGNPVRLDLEEGAAMLGVDFILNVVVDGKHHIVGAVAGEVTAAHRAGCQMVAKRGLVPIPTRADIVLASAGGFPKDINFYQAHKALQNARHAVKPGGTIILVAECSEGIGHAVFESWLFGPLSPQERQVRIQQEFVLGGHLAAAIAAIQEQAQIAIVSQIPAEAWRPSGILPYPTPQEALEAALHRCGTGSTILALPQAVSVLPQVQ